MQQLPLLVLLLVHFLDVSVFPVTALDGHRSGAEILAVHFAHRLHTVHGVEKRHETVALGLVVVSAANYLEEKREI